MDYETIKNYAECIINSSLEKSTGNYLINQRLYDYENSVFKLDANTQKLLKNKINYEAAIKLLSNDIADNLKWLKTLNDTSPQNNSYGFPVKKILLCEGITEETLLPEFARLCGYNFKEHGIYIISAGGKNQVVKYFYNFADSLKIPVFILLDNDAEENLREIKPRMREMIKFTCLKAEEFEDLLLVH